MDDARIRWVLRKMVLLLKVRHRPVYVGELSMEAGVGLDRTEMLLDHLCESGVVRYLTKEEKAAQNLDRRGEIVELLDASLVPHVDW
jgi:hypothetical protein